MSLKKATSFAKKQGGVGAEPFDVTWSGFEVYRLIPCDGCRKMCLGTPILILADRNGERLAKPDEVDAILEEKYSSAEYEDD